MKLEVQEIYINLDDSGKLTTKEKISVYAGVVFLSKKEKDKFITQYRSIIKDIKCNYCKNNNCDKNCPELKNTNIKASDKRRIMNYIKKYYTVSLIIKNNNVYNHIIEKKAAKGRFTDYSLRRLIKGIINDLIENKKIDPNKSIRLIINIDEQSTKNNGYYNLRDGLLEELKYGIVNYDYSKKIYPIVHSNLDIKVTYYDSSKSFVIKASDFLAGTVRKEALEMIENECNINSESLTVICFSIILP